MDPQVKIMKYAIFEVDMFITTKNCTDYFNP